MVVQRKRCRSFSPNERPLALLSMTAELSSKAEEERLGSQLLTRKTTTNILPNFATKHLQPANMAEAHGTVPKEDEAKKRAGENFCCFVHRTCKILADAAELDNEKLRVASRKLKRIGK